jgi:hypothetical protein
MPFDLKPMDNGLKIVANIPIAAVGENWETAVGPKTVTTDDLKAAVAALADPAIKTPRVKLGHLDPRFTPDKVSPDGDPFDGTPVLGRFENLQIGDKGMTLYADAVGVPEWFANIMPFAYPNRSVEGGWSVSTPTGQTHDFVITAVALLGDEYPAIETLDDLQILFSKDGPDWAKEVEAKYQGVAASKGEPSMPDRRIAASTSVEDIRRSFFEDFATAETGRWDWWTRAVYIDPNLVIATDFDDNLYACPYTIDGDSIEWGEPAEVFTQYVETDSGKIAAAKLLGDKPAVATFGKSGGSRPDNKEKEARMAIDLAKLRARTGLSAEQLPDDATEEQINAALDLPASQGGATGIDPSQTDNPSAPDPGTKEAGALTGEPVEANPDQLKASREGTLIDAEALKQLQADAAAGREARKEQVSARRANKVSEAIKAGKIPPSRKDHFSKLMERDEEGTVAYLDSLQAGVLPVADEEVGAGGEPDGDLSENNGYDETWLSDGERARIAAAREGKPRSTRVVTEAV